METIRRVMLNFDGFVKQVDTDYIRPLIGNAEYFRYPLKRMVSSAEFDVSTPIIRFTLVACSKNCDYYEGELE